MFDPSKYSFTSNGSPSNAPFFDGAAVLYRTMPLQYAKKHIALNGASGLFGKREGRFNAVQQPATYSATNALISFSEILSHMHDGLMKGIQKRMPPSQIYSDYVSKRCRLTVISIDRLDNLIHIESPEARAYDSRIQGTAVVSTFHEYGPLQEFANALRACPRKPRGVIYPSARHKSDLSHDMCCALFYDESAIIKKFQSLEVTLSLVDEYHFSRDIPGCDPYGEKVHPLYGHYEFSNIGVLDKLVK